MEKRIAMEQAWADVFSFEGVGEVNEYHIVIHAKSRKRNFQQQLDAVLDAYSQLLSNHLPPATVAVFKRYFLSDAANQADVVLTSDTCDCAKSIIEQPPLDGSKVSLWAYLMTGVSSRVLPSGLCEVSHNGYRHLWNASAHNLAANSEYQTRLLFNEYIMQLTEEGCTLADNCLRTWLFVNDIDLNYGGVVRARNQVFFTQGLTHDTHYIASTGIGGRQEDPNVLCQMDNYAVSGISPEQVHYLYAPTHLNRTSDYGVSFERGTYVDYGDRRHVIISGTASINNKGLVMYERDVERQTHRLLENVETLLAEAGCDFGDVGQMTVYLRDPSDYELVSTIFAERFPGKPSIVVHASVCRPGWLVEMECMAVRRGGDSRFSQL